MGSGYVAGRRAASLDAASTRQYDGVVRSFVAILIVVSIVGVGCSTRSTEDVAIDCEWSGAAPRDVDVTFVADGRLYADPRDADRACVLDVGATSGPELEWGPKADRVLLAADHAVLPSGKKLAPFERAKDVSWSRPEGKSVLAITEDGRLLKRRTIEERATDVSFLDRHDEAVYHPAGRHIVSVGENDASSYGIFIATNEGKDVKQLAIGESAKRIYSLSVDVSGTEMLYAADHGSYREIHILGLEQSVLDTLLKTKEQIVGIEASLHNLVAVELGSCAQGVKVSVLNDPAAAPTEIGGTLKGKSVRIVGWLANREVVLLARERGCVGPADVYVVRPNDDPAAVPYSEPELIAKDVDAAAVRVSAPPPPRAPRISTDPPEA